MQGIEKTRPHKTSRNTNAGQITQARPRPRPQDSPATEAEQTMTLTQHPRLPPLAPSPPLAPHPPEHTLHTPEVRPPPQQQPTSGLSRSPPASPDPAPTTPALSQTWRERQAAPGLPALGLPRPVAIDALLRLVTAPQEERRGSAEASSCCCHSGRGHVPPGPPARKTRGSTRREHEASLSRRLEPVQLPSGKLEPGGRSPAPGQRPRA